jgi:hypothetical protein
MSPETLLRKCRETTFWDLQPLVCYFIYVKTFWYRGGGKIYISSARLTSRGSWVWIPVTSNQKLVAELYLSPPPPKKMTKLFVPPTFFPKSNSSAANQDVNICCGCSFAKSLSSRNDTYQTFMIDLKRGGGGMSW